MMRYNTITTHRTENTQRAERFRATEGKATEGAGDKDPSSPSAQENSPKPPGGGARKGRGQFLAGRSRYDGRGAGGGGGRGREDARDGRSSGDWGGRGRGDSGGGGDGDGGGRDDRYRGGGGRAPAASVREALRGGLSAPRRDDGRGRNAVGRIDWVRGWRMGFESEEYEQR